MAPPGPYGGIGGEGGRAGGSGGKGGGGGDKGGGGEGKTRVVTLVGVSETTTLLTSGTPSSSARVDPAFVIHAVRRSIIP